ncbi:MAG TPA: tetratricopeptide repeat protein [Pyrinomonadaceae bacterium]|nr:tetratricopeptide repeat protein [Pyrinomonadaceae bacterium]
MPRQIFCALAACLFLLFAAPAARAQRITGQVRYAENNQAAFNVPVRCEGIGVSMIQHTDRSGNFTCLLGSPGSYAVYVSVPGYFEERHSFHLPDATSSEYVFVRLRVDPKAAGDAPPTTPLDPSVPAEAAREFRQGEAALAGGGKEKIEEAVLHFEKAVALHPNFTQAHLSLGAAYMDLQQWEKAEQALRRTLALDPKAANAHFALGEMFLRQKKFDEAERSLQEGLKLEMRSWQGHLALARVYWLKAAALTDEAQARPPLALAYQEANEALKLKPELAEAHLLKGNLLLRARRAGDALKEFKEYLRLAPRGEHAAQTKALVEKIEKGLAEQPKQ